STTGSTTRLSRRRSRSSGRAHPRRPTASRARWRRWCRACAAWTFTRFLVSRRHWTGRGRWPRSARPGSTARWSTRRSARRSSTRRIWSGYAKGSRRWSRKQGVPETELLPRLGREQEERSFTASSSGYSAEELLRQKDFDEMTWEETEQVRRLLEQAAWRVAERRTRRMRPGKTGRIDLRRSARSAIRSSGEL